MSAPARAAARLLEARTALLELVLPPPAPGPPNLEAGARAVELRNAIETLEAAAENYGAVRVDEPAPYVPVSLEERAEVFRALEEWHAELDAARKRTT